MIVNIYYKHEYSPKYNETAWWKIEHISHFPAWMFNIRGNDRHWASIDIINESIS